MDKDQIAIDNMKANPLPITELAEVSKQLEQFTPNNDSQPNAYLDKLLGAFIKQRRNRIHQHKVTVRRAASKEKKVKAARKQARHQRKVNRRR